MSSSPIHYQDKHRMKQLEETKVIGYDANDIIRIIQEFSNHDAREMEVKTETYYIKAKR